MKTTTKNEDDLKNEDNLKNAKDHTALPYTAVIFHIGSQLIANDGEWNDITPSFSESR